MQLIFSYLSFFYIQSSIHLLYLKSISNYLENLNQSVETPCWLMNFLNRICKVIWILSQLFLFFNLRPWLLSLSLSLFWWFLLDSISKNFRFISVVSFHIHLTLLRYLAFFQQIRVLVNRLNSKLDTLVVIV